MQSPQDLIAQIDDLFHSRSVAVVGVPRGMKTGRVFLTALLDQSYAGASYGVLHKSDQIEGLLGRFLGLFGCRTSSWSVPSYQGTTTSSRWTFGTIEDGNEDDAYAHIADRMP